MKTKELRKKFLDFFEEKGHKIIPSSPVIPHDDPTLLFVNAGMNQFKKVFLGQTSVDYQTAATSQKCVRVGGKHNDLDNVGHTNRHCTFFEMLGNFSFGDYFKEKAISYAWDLSTNILEIDPADIWVTIYHDDDEAFELWKKHLKEDRIIRIATSDNFWSMGDVGPCGPCSELFFDQHPDRKDLAHPGVDPDGERFLEFWNLVFMQYNKDQSGKLNPLPNPCVDTGMGLERMISLKTGVPTLFETDILQSLIRKAEEISGKSYATNKSAFNVIADHLRMLSFAIADGAQPSNLDRGYVLRKVLRRSVRYARQIGLNDSFMAKMVPTLINEMGEDFPELVTASSRIEELLTTEEESFARTMRRGGNILNTIIDGAKQSKSKQISGEDAFKLKDTYGFPVEEIILLAKDSALEVNLDAFMLLEEKAKELSRQAHTKHNQVAEGTLFSDFSKDHKPTQFLGYDKLEVAGSIVGILKDGALVEKIEEGEKGSLILDQTSFYAEMGGQVGDTGEILHHSANFVVKGTTSPYPGIILHEGVVRSGTLIKGEPVNTNVEKSRRQGIEQNHTTTHLVHWALEQVLGSHIQQAGSLVEEDRLRLDFSHQKPVSPEEIRQIEKLINEKINANGPVETTELDYETVKNRSDIKQIFGEKYADKVRVVNINEFSKELCGGTHVDSLKEIGLFRVLRITSKAAGVRRIEAVTGKAAQEIMYEKEDQIAEIAKALDTQENKILGKIGALAEERRVMKEQLKQMRKGHLKTLSTELMAKSEKAGDIPMIASRVNLYKEEFAPLANDLLTQFGSGILLLAMENDGRCQLLIKVSPDLIEKGYKAGALIRDVAAIVGGSGGGKPDTAQAGGKNPEKLDDAFAKMREILNKPIG